MNRMAEVELSQLHFREMVAQELDAVLAIEQLAYAFPWTKGILNDCFISKTHACWLLCHGDTLCAYGVLSAAAAEAHVLNVCVHPDWRSQGLGRLMMNRLIDEAESRAAETVFLEVRASNQAAIKLYESLGFNEVGLRQGYYPAQSGREDALVMALMVSPPALFSL